MSSSSLSSFLQECAQQKSKIGQGDILPVSTSSSEPSSILSKRKRTSCEVRFSAVYEPEKLALLQLTPELEKILFSKADENDGECPTLCFKGFEGGGMVACTDSKTFEVRRVESSNTTLLASMIRNQESETDGENRGSSLSVDTCTAHFYEFETIPPKFKSLWSMLNRRPYSFNSSLHLDAEEGERPERPTLSDLLLRLQASENQIRSKLVKMPRAIAIMGRWSVIESKCFDETFDHLIFAFDENPTWSKENFPADEWIRTFAKSGLSEKNDGSVSTIRRHVAQYICEEVCFVRKCENTSSAPRVVDFRKMAKLRAAQILRADPGRKWSKDDFESEWQSRLPAFDGEKLDMEWVSDRILPILSDRDGKALFRKFPVETYELEPNPSDRFCQLFNIRAEWTLDELRPFLSDFFATEKEGSLLTKHTRSYTAESGNRVYCRR